MAISATEKHCINAIRRKYRQCASSEKTKLARLVIQRELLKNAEHFDAHGSMERPSCLSLQEEGQIPAPQEVPTLQRSMGCDAPTETIAETVAATPNIWFSSILFQAMVARSIDKKSIVRPKPSRSS